MSSSRMVLLIHPDEARRHELRAQLHGFEVCEAASRRDAAPLLTDELSLVVAHHQDFKKLLRDLDRHAPAAVRAVLCPSDGQQRAALVEVAAQGYDFLTLDENATLALRELASPRRTARLTPATDFTVTFTKAGVQFEGALVDLSSDGLSVRLTAEAPSELLAVGAQVGAVVIRGPGAVVLEHPAAQVRSRDRGRVGLLFTRQSETPASQFAATHPVQVVGALRRAMRRGEAFSLGSVDGTLTVACARAAFDPARNLVTLEGVGPTGFRPGEVVRVSFERAGRVFQGTTVVIDVAGEARAVALPSKLVQRNRRQSLRFTPRAGAPLRLRLRCPFTGRASEHQLTDLQPGGAAFSFEDGVETYPPGLLAAAELELGEHRLALTVQVQSLSQGGATRRAGVRFRGLTPGARQALSDALVTLRLPEVRCASTAPFSAVWELAHAAGAGFPDYDPSAAVPAALAAVHAQVGDGQHGLAKAFVWRSEGQLVGHIAGLRIYSGTWLSQHLAVRPGHTRGVAVSQSLVGLMVDHAEALEDVRWVRGVWQRSNRWTSRIYGAIAGRLARTGGVARSSFELCERTSLVPLEAGEPARPAGEAELGALLEQLRTRSREIWLQANDLTPEGLSMTALGARYQASGLVRSRTVGVVGPSSAPRGWVLLEDMTPGLCWAELFRTFTFVLAEPDAADAARVRAALLGFAHLRAAERGWPVVRARVDALDARWLEGAGYANLGGVEELTGHRSLLREWNELLLATFERAASVHREGESA